MKCPWCHGRGKVLVGKWHKHITDHWKVDYSTKKIGRVKSVLNVKVCSDFCVCSLCEGNGVVTSGDLS